MYTPTKSTKLSLTDAIAHVESDFGKRMRTGDGQCNGWHMLSRDAWQDVSNYRRKNGGPVLHYRHAFDYKDSTSYCQDYLTILSRQLTKEFGRKATTREVLCCFRGGFHNFKRLDFNAGVYSRYLLGVEKYL